MSSLRSLQDLCEDKVVEEMTKPDFDLSEFGSLNFHVQELLFKRMQAKWSHLQKRCPELDLQFFQETDAVHPEIPKSGVDGSIIHSDDGVKHLEQWSKRAEYFTKLWLPVQHIVNARYISLLRKDTWAPKTTRWSSMNIGFEAPGGELKFRSQVPFMELKDPKFDFRPFRKRISSQLLLYRVVALFGGEALSKMNLDGRPLIWSIQLRYYDGTAGFLLYDRNGDPYAELFGWPEAGSEHALELLKFLCDHNDLPPRGLRVCEHSGEELVEHACSRCGY